MQDLSSMKTKIIITTRYVGKDDFIFDSSSTINSESVSALSRYAVSDCRIMYGEDVDIIALNTRVPGCTDDPLTRIKGIIDHFCPEGIELIYLILHSRTDLPLSNFQRQPIGEYRGWSNEKLSSTAKGNNPQIRIWSMCHEVTLDKSAYILTKKAYVDDKVNARAVLDRVESLFIAEDISLLWKEYRNNPNTNNLDLIIDKINKLQSYPFIEQQVDVASFKEMSIPLQFLQIKRLTGKEPNIFKAWQK